MDVSIGIVRAQQIEFNLNTEYTAKGQTANGPQSVEFSEGGIRWNGMLYQELNFTPLTDEASFTLNDVTIGNNFHWERKEQQTFLGTLRFIVEEGMIRAINVLPVEDYLVSVISSEMSGTSSLEFLKAHAVISRSWLMAQIEKRKNTKPETQNVIIQHTNTDTEKIRWYDRTDHTLFDVCADDHCQRYQGITRASNPIVAQAVKETEGEMLMYGEEICDARFSKCCGGVTEEFENCWENVHKNYLESKRDIAEDCDLPDLTIETEARKWILSNPQSLCNTSDPHIISQILNDYDQETADFYRWKITYSQSHLSELINQNTRDDFGEVLDLIPIERGKSGRLTRMKIVGTKKSLIIGKELEIRRVLSTSHLFSSAIVIDHIDDQFVIHGAGWGHGVGLCQIGAAVMGEQGYDYKQILLHYYSGAELKKIY